MKGPRCRLAWISAALQAIFVAVLVVWYITQAIRDWL